MSSVVCSFNLLTFQGYCCGSSGQCCMDQSSSDSQPGTIKGPSVLFDSSKLIPLDPTQELIFPPALKVSIHVMCTSITCK